MGGRAHQPVRVLVHRELIRHFESEMSPNTKVKARRKARIGMAALSRENSTEKRQSMEIRGKRAPARWRSDPYA